MKLKQGIASSCDLPNFTECDRCVLNLLRPHLMQVDESSPACSQIQQILTQFRQALEQGGVISLTSDGQVEFMTQRAEHLLKQYFPSGTPHALPDLLNHWLKHQISQLTFNGNIPFPCLPLRIERAGRRLIIRLIPNPRIKQYVLLVEEQETAPFSISALALLGLTKREAEVLLWIAKDKSNAGIARVLDCSEGTVRKHLENIYKKLGVQTRMGAVMTALETVGILKGSFVAKLL